jgi:hypothetical protein
MEREVYVRELETAAQTPEGALRMLFRALLHLERDPRGAEQLLAHSFNGKQLYRDERAPSGWDVGNSVRFLLQQLQRNPNIVRSYLGGTPERGYTDFDAENLPLLIHPDGAVVGGVRCVNTLQPPRGDQGQLPLQSRGKDLPTIIYAERNPRGLWKIDTRSLSNVATGVKAPPVTDF